MNKIYKVIWSRVKHCYVVVSEIAKREGKSTNTTGLARHRAAILAVATLCLVGGIGVQTVEAKIGDHYMGVYDPEALEQDLSKNNKQWGNDNDQPKPTNMDYGTFGIMSKGGRIDKRFGLITGVDTFGRQIDEGLKFRTSLGAKFYNLGFGASTFGYGSTADGKKATALGYGSYAKGADSLAVGALAKVTADQGIAIGANTVAGNQATAVGTDSKATGYASIAIGSDDAQPNATQGGEFADRYPVEFMNKIFADLRKTESDAELFDGKYALVPGKRDYRVWSPNYARGQVSIAIGARAVGYGNASTAVGALAFALGEHSTAVGVRSYVSNNAPGGIAMGELSRVMAKNGLAVGNLSYSDRQGSVAYGYDAKAVGDNSIAIGHSVGANVELTQDSKNILEKVLTYRVATNPTKVNGISLEQTEDRLAYLNKLKENWADDRTRQIGEVVGADLLRHVEYAKKQSTVTINGRQEWATNAIAIGRRAYAIGDNSMVMGSLSLGTGTNSLGIGYMTYTSGDNATAIGMEAIATAKNAMAIGVKSYANLENSIAIGVNSRTDYTKADLEKDGWVPRGAISFPSSTQVGIVSVGSVGQERRIANVAAGYRDTDAVNVSQLRSIEDRFTNNLPDDDVANPFAYTSIEKNKGDAKNVLPLQRQDNNYRKYVHYRTKQLEIMLKERGGERIDKDFKQRINDAVKKLADNRENAYGIQSTKLGGIGDVEVLLTELQKIDPKFKDRSNIEQALTVLSVYKKGLLKDTLKKSLNPEDLKKLGATNYLNDGAQGKDAIAIGYKALALGDDGIAIGKNSHVPQNIKGGIALGTDALADRDKGQFAYDPETGKAFADDTAAANAPGGSRAMKSSGAALSIGNGKVARQIINVAGGTEDTDAVNVAQLKRLGASVDTKVDNKLNDVLDKGLKFHFDPEWGGTPEVSVKRDNSARILIKGKQDGYNRDPRSEFVEGNIGVFGNDFEIDKKAGAKEKGLILKLKKNLTGLEGVELKKNVDNKDVTVRLNYNGINMGGNKITNMADGALSANSTDVVTGKQLYAVKTHSENLENAVNNQLGLNITGDKENVQPWVGIGTKTNQRGIIAFGVQGGESDESKLTTKDDKNIGVIISREKNGQPKDTVDKTITQVRLAKNLKNLESIELKKTDKGKDITVTLKNDGIDMGTNKITNMADATLNVTSTEAVTGKQLYGLQNNATDINVTNWTNKLGTGTIGGTNDSNLVTGVTVKSALDKKVDTTTYTTGMAGKADTGLTNITNGAKDVITGLTNVVGTGAVTVTPTTDNNTRTKTFTVNVAKDGQVADNNTGLVTGGTVKAALDTVGFNIAGDTGDQPKIAVTPSPKGVQLNIKGNTAKGADLSEGNIGVVAATAKGNTSPTLTVKLAKKLANLEEIKLSKDNKTVTLSNTGIDMGSQKITNMADGALSATSADAVTGKQLYGLQENATGVNVTNWTTALGTGTIGGTNDSNLVTGATVKAALDNKVDTTTYTTGMAGKADTGLGNITDDGKTVIKNLTKVVGDDVVTVTPSTDEDGAQKFTVKVAKDGVIADKNTGLVTGGTVKEALDNKVDTATYTTGMQGKANVGLDNISDAGKTVIKNLAKEQINTTVNETYVTGKVKKGALTSTTLDIQGAGKLVGDNLTIDIKDQSITKAKLATALSNELDGKMASWVLKASSDADANKAGQTINNTTKDVIFGVATDADTKGLTVTRTGNTITYGINKADLAKAIEGDIITNINNSTTPITNISANFSISDVTATDTHTQAVSLTKDSHPTIKFLGEKDKIDVTVGADDKKNPTVTVTANTKLGENLDLSNNTSIKDINTKITNITKADGDLSKKADKDATNINDTDKAKWIAKLGDGTIDNAKTNANLVTGATVKTALDQKVDTTTYNTDMAGKADTALSNITAAGKTVITGLVDVKGEGGATVESATNETSHIKTFTVKVANDGQIKDGNTGLVTGGTVKTALDQKMASWVLKASSDPDDKKAGQTIDNTTKDVIFDVATDDNTKGLTVTRAGNKITYGINKTALAKAIEGDIINNINSNNSTAIDNISANFSISGAKDANKQTVTLTKTSHPNIQFLGEENKIDVTVGADGTTPTVTVKANTKLGENLDLSNNTSIKDINTKITNITKDGGDLSNKADKDASNIDAGAKAKWIAKLGDGTIDDAKTNANLVTGATVKTALDQKVDTTTYNTDMAGKADTALSNITPAGKDVITGLVDVKGEGGATVTSDVNKTSHIKTFTVKVAKDGAIADKNTGLVTGDTVYDYIDPIAEQVTTNKNNINTLQTNVTNLQTDVTNLNKNLTAGFNLQVGDKSSAVVLNAEKAPTVEFAVKEVGKGLTVEKEGTKITYGIEGSKIDLAGNTSITNINNRIDEITVKNGGDISKKADKDATNIDAAAKAKWIAKLGDGTIDDATTNANLVTGATVHAAIKDKMASWVLKASSDSNAEDAAQKAGQTINNTDNAVIFDVATDANTKGLTVTRTGNKITYGINKTELAKAIEGDIINNINSNESTAIDNISAKFSISDADATDTHTQAVSLTKTSQPTIKFLGEKDKIDVTVGADGTTPTVTVKANTNLGQNLDLSNNKSITDINTAITNITKDGGDLSNKADKDAKNIDAAAKAKWIAKLGDGTIDDAATKANLVTGATVKTALDQKVDTTTYNTDMAGKADTALSNITDTGKDVITGLVDVKGEGGATVESATGETSHIKTFTVKVAKDGAIAKDNTGLVTGGTVYNYINPIAEQVTTNKNNINTLQTNVTNLQTDVTNLNKNLTAGFNLQVGDKSSAVVLNAEKTPTVEFAVKEAGKGLTVEKEGTKITYGIDGSKIDLAGNTSITNINNRIDEITVKNGGDFSKKADKDATNIDKDAKAKWIAKLGDGTIDDATTNANLVTGATVKTALDQKMASWVLKASSDSNAEDAAQKAGQTINNTDNAVIFDVATDANTKGLTVTRTGNKITYGINKTDLAKAIEGDIINNINSNNSTVIDNISANFSISGAKNANKQTVTLTKTSHPNIQFLGEENKIDVTVGADGTTPTVTVKANAKLGENLDLSKNTSITNLDEKINNITKNGLSIPGEDGKSIAGLNGKDGVGHLELAGKNGTPSIDMTAITGDAGVDGKDGITRLQYIDGNKKTHQVATLDDGMKYAGDNAGEKILAKKLNSQVDIVGDIGTGKTETAFTTGNIGVFASATDGKLHVKLANAITVNTVTLQDSDNPQAPDAKKPITLTNKKGGLYIGNPSTDDGNKVVTRSELTTSSEAGQNALQTIQVKADGKDVKTLKKPTDTETTSNVLEFEAGENVQIANDGGKVKISAKRDQTADTITVGVKGKDGKDGKDGKIGVDGKDGKSGVGIDGKDGITIIGHEDPVKPEPGKPGKDGRDGTIGINGLDGISMTGEAGKNGVSIKGEPGKNGEPAPTIAGLNGKDGIGHLGLTGAKGEDGKAPSIDMTAIKGDAGVAGKDGITRLQYIDENKKPHQVATLDDGMKYAGDNADTKILAKKLNSQVDIVGDIGTGKTETAFTTGNIGVFANATDGKLHVKLANAITVNTVTLQDSDNPQDPATKKPITLTNKKGGLYIGTPETNDANKVVTRSELITSSEAGQNALQTIQVKADGKDVKTLKKPTDTETTSNVLEFEAGENVQIANDGGKVKISAKRDQTADTITVGVKGKDGKDGKDGKIGVDGKDGKSGVGIDGKNGITIIGHEDPVAPKEGQPGKDGRDGTIGINGLDGISMTGEAGKNGVSIKGEPGKNGEPAPTIAGLNGKDGIGHLGLTGKAGEDGKAPSIDMTAIKGKAGVNGKDGITRLQYIDENNTPHQVATLDDGMKYAGDNAKADGTNVLKKKLNSRVDIIGDINGKEESVFTTGNIGVFANATDGTLHVKLAKELTGLDSVTAGTVKATNSIVVGDPDKGGKGKGKVATLTTSDDGKLMLQNAGVDTPREVLTVTETNNSTTIILGEKGKDGKDGKNGHIGVNGKDGKPGVGIDGKDGITLEGEAGKNGLSIKGEPGKNGEAATTVAGLNGKDGIGHLGLTGAKGEDGKTPSIDMTAIKGKAGVNGKDGITRLQYIDENNTPHQVATLDDGLKFIGNNLALNKHELNSIVKIVGQGLVSANDVNYDGKDTDRDKVKKAFLSDKETQFEGTNDNIGVISNGTDTLTVSLSKNVKHLDSIGTKTIVVGDPDKGGKGKGKVATLTTSDDGKLMLQNDGVDKPREVLTVTETNNSTTIILGEKGKDGKPGKNGHIGVNGKDGKPGVGIDGKDGITLEGEAGKNGLSIKGEDGKSIAGLNGKDGIGHLGLTGKAGKDGTPSIDMTAVEGEADVHDKKITRLNYIDPAQKDKNGDPINHQVATLDDGLKFAGNNKTVSKHTLNSTVKIVGQGLVSADDATYDGKDTDADKAKKAFLSDGKTQFEGTDDNIGVIADDEGNLTVALHKDVKVDTVAAKKGITLGEGEGAVGLKGKDGKLVLEVKDKDGKTTDKEVLTTGSSNITVGSKAGKTPDGKPGTDGQDGTIGVNGKDGSAVVINGKDGSIGLNGKDGKDGISIRGEAGKDKDGIKGKTGIDGTEVTRIVYTEKNPDGSDKKDANGNPITHQVATLDDGMKYAGDNAKDKILAKKLNNQVNIVGDIAENKTEDDFTKGNIGVFAENDGELHVKLAKTVDGLDKVSTKKVVIGDPGKDGTGKVTTLSTDAAGRLVLQKGTKEDAPKETILTATQVTDPSGKVVGDELHLGSGKDGINGKIAVDGKDGKSKVGIDGTDGITITGHTDAKDGQLAKNGTIGINGTNGITMTGDAAKAGIKVGNGPVLNAEGLDMNGTGIKGLGSISAKTINATGDDGKPTVSMDGKNGTLSFAGTTGADGKAIPGVTLGTNNGRLVVLDDNNKPKDTVALVSDLQDVVNKTDTAIMKIDRNVRNVGANAAAMAMLKPLQYDPLEPTQIMAAIGSYRGTQAAAIGLSHYTNESTMFNVGVSVGAGNNMMGVGVTRKFGSSADERAVPDRYKAGPISSVYVMQDEVTALKAENRQIKESYYKVLQDNEEMKAKLDALMKKLGL